MRWLKRALRRWLEIDEPVSDRSLLVTDGGKGLRRVFVVRAIGTYLVVREPDGERMIGEWKAADRSRFWKLWEEVREGEPDLVWENGERFKRPVI